MTDAHFLDKLGQTPLVMGVLNVTPDSFFDGGRFCVPEQAFEQAKGMIEAGVDIIDIGGESTRPGALAVSTSLEIERVIPILIELKRQYDIPISIDTRNPVVMEKALEHGADMINDVNALQAEGALEILRDSTAMVCLMHAQGSPDKMQDNPRYEDPVQEIYHYLEKKLNVAIDAGISRDRLIADPGIGFGKRLEHNLALIQNLENFKSLQVPIIMGLSRKSMFGELLDKGPDGRLAGTLGASMVALQNGTRILRAHDVEATKDLITVYQALNSQQ